MNIIKAFEELEKKKREIKESQKCLLDAAKKKFHIEE